jgi:hypothetical protein
MSVREPLEQRFFKYFKIGRPDDCWPWEGAYQGFGRSGGVAYGRIGTGVGKQVEGAHRVSYMLHHGEIPPRMVVRHSCDNPSCVNPKHLNLGTQNDNIADMVSRARHLAGHCARIEKVKARTHCKHGHSYEGLGYRDYTNSRGSTGRVCMECDRIAKRATAKAKRKRAA